MRIAFRFLRPVTSSFAIAALVASAAIAQAADPVSLTEPGKAWSFGRGAEFPGAKGSLTVADGSLELVGDFTGGGGYVQAGRKIDGIDVRELSLRLRSANTDRLTVRLGDASGQTHQIVLRIDAAGDWQRIVFPLERFFARRGQADAVTSVLQYQSWGGAKDGRWHGPATGLHLLVSNAGKNVVRTISFRDVSVVPRPTAVPGAETRAVVRLDEIIEGLHDWAFSNGPEFKGAKGTLSVVENAPDAGKSGFELAGDFTDGGAYVAAIRSLDGIAAQDTTAFRLRVRSKDTTTIGVQIVDGSGQTHQRKDVRIAADDEWHDLALIPKEIAGGEHWGGADDGQWHGPARRVAISLTKRSAPESKRPSIQLADIRVETLVPVFAQPAAFTANFDAERLDMSWTVTEGVTIEGTSAGDRRALLLSRSLENVQRPCSATGPAFAAAPGQWEVRLTSQADLHSPDDSYNAVVQLECQNSAGEAIDRKTVFEAFGKRERGTTKSLVELPPGTASARIRLQIQKTHGRFLLDDLSVAYLAPAPPRDDVVERLLFSTSRLGNLLFPDDPRRVTIEVEARRPLGEARRRAICVVRDYWGAEQMRSVTIAFGSPEKTKDRFTYQAELDLSAVPLEIGRYYELHAEIPLAGGEPFRNHTSLAILPEAVTRQFKPEDVPFTARNWDNRIEEFVRLTDRLGIRVCGVWGGWKSKPPYEPEAPRLDLIKQLGMGWLTTTPAKFIEQGKRDYDEPALRQGVRNLIAKYGDVRPLIVNLGNEPHGTGDVVRRNVEAYRVLYDEIKKVDPGIRVVATSVEPNEEYFRLGYGKWCDAFDFHIYEDSEKVRRTIREYGELARQYGVTKPIWSTELGLNSQGLPRHRVAVELVRKFATFFAAGGENASWFGLLYPDPQGKNFGGSADSHNVFDCRYGRYCPRLDAVAYYHAVNAIAIKKFVEEKRYPGGPQAFLFRDRDGRCLQILWNDAGRADVRLPLPGVARATVIRIDGSSRSLRSDGDGIALTVSGDPAFVLYESDGNTLAAELPASDATLEAPPDEIARTGSTTLVVRSRNVAGRKIALSAPPFWTVEESPPSTSGDATSRRFKLTPPATTSAREADLAVTIADADDRLLGELHHRIPLAE